MLIMESHVVKYFSGLVLCPPSWSQISSSTLSTRKPAAHTLPLIEETKIHTRKNQRKFSLYIFRYQREEERFWTEWQQTQPELNFLLISSRIQVVVLRIITIYTCILHVRVSNFLTITLYYPKNLQTFWRNWHKHVHNQIKRFKKYLRKFFNFGMTALITLYWRGC